MGWNFVRFGVCAAVLALFGACGGSPAPKPGGVSGTPENSAGVLPTAGRFFTPGLPVYAAPTGLGATGLERQVRAKLTRALQAPPAMDCLAREYAARFAVDGRDPDPGTIQALAHHCGFWGLPQDAYSVTAPSKEALSTHLQQLPVGQLTGGVGVGVVEHPDGKVTVSLLAAPQIVRIEPVGRKLTSAGVKVAGRILRGDGQTEVWVSRAGGAPEKLKIDSTPTGDFSVQVPTAAPGPVRIEVVRRTGRFRATVALLLLQTAIPNQYDPFIEAGPRDHAALVKAINGARKAKGLTPLVHRTVHDAKLDGWLVRAAESGGPTKSPAGMSEPDGTPYGRLRYAFARGADAAQAVRLLTRTPTGQRVLFNKDDDEISVGLKPFPRGTGFDAVVVSLRKFDRMPGPQARAIVTAKLAQARSARSLAPLRESGRLQALAETAASEVLAGTLPWKQVVPHLMSRVREGSMAQGSFAAGAFTVVGPDAADFANEAQALAAEMRYLGIGVIGGSLPGDQVPRYVVIYVVAQGVPGQG